MLALELLRMIEKFEEKYPDVDLVKKEIYIDCTGKHYGGISSSYEVGLRYIDFNTSKQTENKIFIPELKSILEKNKYKKLYIKIEGEVLLSEIPWLEKCSDLCYFLGGKPIKGNKFVYREEIKNVKS